ncbi:MAG: Domain of uncharacterized function [Hydrocarboniphaga sp.]|nr:Domain of uncharacterized function [Hydrocarboniphaga sp.]
MRGKWPHPVHPRSHGEREACARYCHRYTGSSPLTRGTPDIASLYRSQERFIPAHTGNASCCLWGRLLMPVHPRSHGERPCLRTNATLALGSSPLTRGTRVALDGSLLEIRFIPAHTGNARSPRDELPNKPVHPRSHGERLAACSQYSSRNGSSPLTRGTRRKSCIHCSPRPVHPRSHGERDCTLIERKASGGSSPLTRGTLDRIAWLRRCIRFIPAHTGNARPSIARAGGNPVHPRSHGERVGHCDALGGDAGSSPLTRGTRSRPWHSYRPSRFIPAHTGNAQAKRYPKADQSVHPRSHGERTKRK